MGWGLGFAAVLDRDREGKAAAKDLTEKLTVSEAQVIYVADRDGSSIEDVFSVDDFNSQVHDLTKRVTDSKNSQALRDAKADKVVVAKEFFAKVNADPSAIQLGAESREAIRRLLAAIAAAFGASS